MSLAKASRKLKRLGKNAVQFRISSTFEFIDLECKSTWRPDQLRVVWLRNHRKVKSNDTSWVVSEDFGPNGAKGRAVFNPAISVSLVVTLYRDANATDFEDKEYRYQVENEGPGGKKILATFNCNVSEFVGIPSTKQALDLNFKCVSKKVKVVKLGILLESQFLKQGGAFDDDMQSTFSAMSAGMDSVTYDDDDEDEVDGGDPNEVGEVEFHRTGEAHSPKGSPLEVNRTRLNTLQEEQEESVTATMASRQQGGAGAMEEEEEEEEEERSQLFSSTEAWLDREVVLVDCFGEAVSRDRLDHADMIGLYFSAGWCPPCRRFLPKLVKFYHHLKQHDKALEIVYISSDYSKLDMMKYMKEQQMPWLGVSYEGNLSEELRKKFNVSAVPLFKVMCRNGSVLEDSAKKSVEGASSGSAILKLYNKWQEKLVSEENRINTPSKERKGFISKVKATIHSKDKRDSEQLEMTPPTTPENGRRAVDNRTARSTKTRNRGGGGVSKELLEEKEERIQHLEEVNRILKQTNDDLQEELREMRTKLDIVTAELEHTKTTSKTLADESKELIANLNMRGWLFKRGVKGLTASVWRRRYFRLDQGSKLYYYKNSSEGNPQGYIDIDRVIGVQEVTAAQQDKNHATFTVQCDGRTFQLQAHDEASMRKWIEAILYMSNWRKKHSRVIANELS